MPVRRFCWLRRSGLLVAMLGGLVSVAGAQVLRDPTVPPNLLPGNPAARGVAPETRTFDLMRYPDGSYRVLSRGQWLTVGQQLGTARITRITETQVWLQDQGAPRPWTRYPGVSIAPAPVAGPPITPAASHPMPTTGRTSP